MKKDFDFFKTEMPDSRKADFYLGYLDGSVFIDFNHNRQMKFYITKFDYHLFG